MLKDHLNSSPIPGDRESMQFKTCGSRVTTAITVVVILCGHRIVPTAIAVTCSNGVLSYGGSPSQSVQTCKWLGTVGTSLSH